MPRWVIGIPTYNNPGYLLTCLRAIYDYTDFSKHSDTKVLVVDDCSDPDKLEENKAICSSYNIDLLMNPSRYGVPKSWNVLTRHHSDSSEFTVLLNDDVVVTRDWLEVLRYTLEKNPSLGPVGLNAYEGINSNLIPPPIPTYNEANLFFGSLGSEIYSIRGYTFAFRTSDWEAVGGFDERYFAFFEEIDFCLAIMEKLGKRPSILSYPNVIHYHASTTKHISTINEIFTTSKTAFEAKWGFEFSNIRKYLIGKIPKKPANLLLWNSNIGIWA